MTPEDGADGGAGDKPKRLLHCCNKNMSAFGVLFSPERMEPEEEAVYLPNCHRFIPRCSSFYISNIPHHNVTPRLKLPLHGAKPQVAEQKGPPPSPPGHPVLPPAFKRKVPGLEGLQKGSITGCRPSGELSTCHLHSIFPHLDTTSGLWAPVTGPAFLADSLGRVFDETSPRGPGPRREPGSLGHEPDPGWGPGKRTCESSKLQRLPRPSSSAGAGAHGLGPYKALEFCSADPELCIDPVGQDIIVRK